MLPEQIILLSSFGLIAVLGSAGYIYQHRLRSRWDKEKDEEFKRHNWHYEPISLKDSAFRISGTSGGASWLLEHQKSVGDSWNVTWSTPVASKAGEIWMGSRSAVAFEQTLAGRLFLAYAIWRLKKEQPEEVALLKQEMKKSHVLELQNPFLQEDYVISAPAQHEAFALELFDTEVQKLIEEILRDWPEASGPKNRKSFLFHLAGEKMEIKIEKKLAQFHSIEQLVNVGVLLLSNYQRASKRS